MFAYPYGGLATGIFFIIAAFFTLARHFLLEPGMTHYPKAPAWVRNMMFAFAMVLAFMGLQFLWVFFSDAPNTVPPQPSPAMQFLSLALCIHKGAMFGNIARQRCPEEVWERLNKINDNLLCRRGKTHPIWRWLGY